VANHAIHVASARPGRIKEATTPRIVRADARTLNGRRILLPATQAARAGGQALLELREFSSPMHGSHTHATDSAKPQVTLCCLAVTASRVAATGFGSRLLQVHAQRCRPGERLIKKLSRLS
jgi:hypothetical protein